MLGNNDKSSIFDNSAEKCCSGIGFGECAYCNKKGLPILLTRYSVRSSHNLKLCDVEANESVANAMPWSLKNPCTVNMRSLESKNNELQEKYEPRVLEQAAEYILRRPRQGYLYIYDEVAHGNWQCYSINKSGYVQIEPLSRPTPLDELPDFRCTKDSSHIAMGSIITLPHPEINRTVYLCHVEAIWSKEWRAKIAKDSAWREQYMQKIVVEGKLSSPDVYSLEELEKIVLEYSNDYYLMGDEPGYHLLRDIACIIPDNKSAIAEFVKKTLYKYTKVSKLPHPVILALHDDAAITLHLNELRVAPHMELDELTKKDDTHRPYLWAVSIMALEKALQQSPYVSIVYDPSVDNNIRYSNGKWKYSKLKPVPDDYFQPDIAKGAPYKQLKKEDDEIKEIGYKQDEELKNNHYIYYKMFIEPQENSVHGAVYISPRQALEASWIEKGEAQERLLVEFYENKYFDFSKYKELKNSLRKIQLRINTESERIDLDYCWWLENRLPKALGCYDPNDQLHKTVVTSLLSRALVGGIVGQSSRNLWQNFHKNPENHPMIINGVLGWNSELCDHLVNSLSNDYSGFLNSKLKHKTLFEEAYIKELGKLVKKGHSFAKGFYDFVDKDFSLKALNALRERHQKAQLIADTVESTHKTLLLDMQYLTSKGLSFDSFARETAFIGKHSSGLKVAQFKMLRIMFVSKMMTGDLVAKITAIDEARQLNHSFKQKKEYLEERYAKKSAELLGCEKAARHLTFIEMPINEVQKEIKRISMRRISNKMGAMGMPTPDVNTKNIQETTTDGDGNKRIIGNTYNIDSVGKTMVQLPVFYNDEEYSIIKQAAEELDRNTINSSINSVSIDEKVSRQRWGRVIFDHYSKAVNSDFSNRWVGRISRVAIYWGFVDSFLNVAKSPSDLKAWWKMSGAVISVTQAYFDVWEMTATDQIKALEKTRTSEYLLEKEILVIDDVASALNNEVNFAKLWSKRLGVITSIISIIDGFKELGHAVHMKEHGELPSDVSAITQKGLVGIASGVVGILLVETAVFGGLFVILAFAVALWLIPSTENLIPLGIRNWLRRSQYGHSEGLNYLPFKSWQDEQSSFEMVLKGIEVDIGVHYCSANEIADQTDKINYNVDVVVRFQEELADNISIVFKGYNGDKKTFFDILTYNRKEYVDRFYEAAPLGRKDSWYRVDLPKNKLKDGFDEVAFTFKKRSPSMFSIYCYELSVVLSDDEGMSQDKYFLGVYR